MSEVNTEVKVDEVAAPVKRGRGRPKGSKNKPKASPVVVPVVADAATEVKVEEHNGF